MLKYNIQQNIDIFKCPVCESKMSIYNLRSLICVNNHCFDLSKNGYVNLLLFPAKKQYDKAMLKARNKICNNGFFTPVVKQVCDNIQEINNSGVGKRRILDAGCGEGSNLNHIINQLNCKTGIHYQGVGIDISKAGIQIASKNYPDNIWCVGDLAKSPFNNRKFDIILNILSPANYFEFNRILVDAGILIKVIPGRNYLKELRDAFYNKTARQIYSNKKIVEHFKENFSLIAQQQLSYTVELEQENLGNFIKMTPLSWRAPGEKIQKLLNIGLPKITVDLIIMCGRKVDPRCR
jgi:23S rRNA (guanine745-N1)-methyltransferase